MCPSFSSPIFYVNFFIPSKHLLLVSGYSYDRICTIALIVRLRTLSSRVRGSWQVSEGLKHPLGERPGTVVSSQYIEQGTTLVAKLWSPHSYHKAGKGCIPSPNFFWLVVIEVLSPLIPNPKRNNWCPDTCGGGRQG